MFHCFHVALQFKTFADAKRKSLFDLVPMEHHSSVKGRVRVRVRDDGQLLQQVDLFVKTKRQIKGFPLLQAFWLH